MGEDIIKKKVIIISAINFFEGGPLAILNECVEFCNKFLHKKYRIIVLVHDVSLFNKYCDVEFLEFKKARSNYLFRLYYEYYEFRFLSKKLNSYLWFSLHDISPNIQSIKKAVYCHNPSPFRKTNFNDLILQPKIFFFSLFYKYLYQINIKSNDFVVVQQHWIRNSFQEFFDLPLQKIIVATPNNNNKLLSVATNRIKIHNNLKTYRFFFPTLSRPFKNIEVIAEAVKILNTNGINKFEVIITIDGSENKYSQSILRKYGNVSNISFIGIIDRSKVFKYYEFIDCLIFPSKLETWGLPISEFKAFNKPILVADLPYSRETVGDFFKTKFFNPDNANELASYMEILILTPNFFQFDQTEKTHYEEPFANDWSALFKILLK